MEAKDEVEKRNKSIKLKFGGRLRIGGVQRRGGTRGPTDQFALGSYGEKQQCIYPGKVLGMI